LSKQKTVENAGLCICLFDSSQTSSQDSLGSDSLQKRTYRDQRSRLS